MAPCPLPLMSFNQSIASSPENFGSFSLEMAHFRANSVVYFKRNVRLFTARIMTIILYIAGGWWSPLTGDSPQNR